MGQVLISNDWSGDNTSDIASEKLASAAATAGTGTSCGHHDGKTTSRLAIADLPGLVPGAHAGKGRGTAFLAHLQKARCLALVIDMTGRDAPQQAQGQHGTSTTTNMQGACDDAAAWGTLVPYTPQQQLSILQVRAPGGPASPRQLPAGLLFWGAVRWGGVGWGDKSTTAVSGLMRGIKWTVQRDNLACARALQDELLQYDKTVMQMPMLIVANKLDALSPDAAAVALQQLKALTGLPMVPISAKHGAGLHCLRTALQLLTSQA